jgi:hypothetical protein
MSTPPSAEKRAKKTSAGTFERRPETTFYLDEER